MARRYISRRAIGVSAVACLAAGALIGRPAAGSVAAVTAGPVSGALTGVSATSASDAWAVGVRFSGTTDLTLIEHWNGNPGSG